MTKKPTRKPNLPQETLERARREMARRGDLTPAPVPQAEAGANVAVSAPTQASHARKASYAEVDLSKEYAYVVTDLKNMGILAAILGVVLVAMSFFI